MQAQTSRKVTGPSTSRGSKIGRISVIQAAVLCATSFVVAFYLGMVLGSSASCSSNVTKEELKPEKKATIRSMGVEVRKDCYSEKEMQDKVQEAMKRAQAKAKEGGSRDTDPRFPQDLGKIVVGMAQVDRDEFAERFNLGVPLDKSDRGNKKVLMMYNGEKSLPGDMYAHNEAKSQTTIPAVSAEEATANCDFLHIILQDHNNARRQCTAVFGQYEAFHIQKFMRLPEERGKMDSKLPLRLVNRGAQSSGRKSVSPPDLKTTKRHWGTLQAYLASMEKNLETLKPIAEKVAVKDTIIVQVCNYGQSELLLNFLCGAKKRGLDTSAILVFATDQETYDLINTMGGVTVVYDKDIFGDMPLGSARAYGDGVFMKMMMAKIYCVHLITLLGYDVLFQDVDVVWYKHPFDYFHNKDGVEGTDANFDVYFQDDGNHALFYAPYSANTGFYFVRNNERTLYFFNSLLAAGDLVIQSRSHQIPLVALLQEHASMYGLRIKIFSRDGDDFPGGHAFHRRKPLMKDIVQGKSLPYIFHMSWTNSKINKKKFFSQMGEWFVNDKCNAQKLDQIYHGEKPTDMYSDCCAAEPIVKCHYRDKPSKIPCKDSPPIDAGGRSFW